MTINFVKKYEISSATPKFSNIELENPVPFKQKFIIVWVVLDKSAERGSAYNGKQNKPHNIH